MFSNHPDAFSRVSWAAYSNIYEVNVRQYTPEGTFIAFQKHLPRLKDMGVKILWFMPVQPIASMNKKGLLGSPYACASYIQVNPEFGTMLDFKNLVDTAHALGMKVIIDWVANHTGWDHEWTKTKPGFYKWNPEKNTFLTASGMEDIIELNYENAEMRSEMIASMKFWLEEVEIDGFRCDLASWVPADFWYSARLELQKIKPLFLLGEYDPTENPDYNISFDAAYTWQWMHKSEDYFHGKITNHELLNIASNYLSKNCMPAWFTSNHDENSWNGTEYEKYGLFAKMLTVFSYTYPGLPLTYSGQELPNLKRLAFFEKDCIAWNNEVELHDFLKTLNKLKVDNAALHFSDSKCLFEILKAENGIWIYASSNWNKRVVTILNFTAIDAKMNVAGLLLQGYNVLFPNGPFIKDDWLVIPASGYQVFHN